MAVQAMKLAYISGAFEKLGELTKTLVDINYFQPEMTCDFLGNAGGFQPITEENPYSSKLARLKSIIAEFGIEARLGKKPKKLIADDVAESFLNRIEVSLKELHSKREGLSGKYKQNENRIEELRHFEPLNIDLKDVMSMEFVEACFGKLPHFSTQKLSLYNDDPYTEFFVSSSDKDFDWGVYFKPRYNSREIDRTFASLFFEPIEVPEYDGSPAEIIDMLERENGEVSLEIKNTEQSLAELVAENEAALFKLYNQINRQHKAYELRSYAARYDDGYMLVGWLPENKWNEFLHLLNKRLNDVKVKSDNDNRRLTPPTKLRNSFLFRPFQYFVEIYGVPDYNEADPTAFVAITYTLLYGIMFADLGQGLLLSIIGFLMYKLKQMPIGKILVPCGICGAVFGVIFGSVFGYEHVLDPFYKKLGFSEKPFDVMENATSLLALSIGIGIALVIVAMIFNIYSKLKQHNYGEAFFGHNGVSGLVLYCSILAVALGTVLKIEFPTTLILLLGIVLPLLLIFFEKPLGSLLEGHGLDFGQSIGDYILENFFVLFEVLLSYFTNTLSFLRVGAFVLIHAGIMTAFFALAGILGGGIPSAIMIVFGNIFVIALEGLLVGIQVLRLEFYEMFSRFYDGNGRLFTPYKIK